MSKNEYLVAVDKVAIKPERVTAIEKRYKVESLDPLVEKIISLADEIGFFDDERRALSYAEIFNPVKNVGVDFAALGLIPLVDAYDNTFIVFVISEQKWAKYHMTDDVLFKKKGAFKAVL